MVIVENMVHQRIGPREPLIPEVSKQRPIDDHQEPRTRNRDPSALKPAVPGMSQMAAGVWTDKFSQVQKQATSEKRARASDWFAPDSATRPIHRHKTMDQRNSQSPWAVTASAQVYIITKKVTSSYSHKGGCPQGRGRKHVVSHPGNCIPVELRHTGGIFCFREKASWII
jgi:hypothetical protein